MNNQLKSNLTASKHWVRLVYMLLFSFFLYIASFVVAVVVVAQFIFSLLTGTDNSKLRWLGNTLSLYIKDVLMFLTFNSEHKAFPFADWPEPEPHHVAEEVYTSPIADQGEPVVRQTMSGGSAEATSFTSGEEAKPLADAADTGEQPENSPTTGGKNATDEVHSPGDNSVAAGEEPADQGQNLEKSH